jgi:hypothetical protein
MRNKGQFFGALVFAAMMSTALSANTDAMGGPARSACIFIEGLVLRGMPAFVGELLMGLAGC